jgi:hypothetical protein
MKFMLMMHAPGKGWEKAGIGTWPAEDRMRLVEHMQDLNEDLKKAGQLVGAEGLVSPEHAKIVRATKARKPSVTDGPFAETKEFLAGYWIVEVATPEEAYEIAARASAAPGPGGEPLNMPIEVREVGSAPKA